MNIFTVRFEIEVNAATPAQAATVARDMMLDPDAPIHVDIFPMEWIEEAEEYHPTHERGWYAWFAGSVHPQDCFAWETLKS